MTLMTLLCCDDYTRAGANVSIVNSKRDALSALAAMFCPSEWDLDEVQGPGSRFGS